MARKTSLVSLQQIGEINLTPLMDLTFILLITFIITFPLIEQGIPVNLPTAEGNDLDDSETMSITVDKEGTLFLNEREISAEALQEEMTVLGQAKPDVTVMVRADELIQYKNVVAVMQILHKAKISRMALVTQSGESVGN